MPSDAVLADAYRRALAIAEINKAIQETRDEAIEHTKAAKIPKFLRRQLQKALKDSPDAWDKVLYGMVEESLLSQKDGN
jgi:biotin carboxylase